MRITCEGRRDIISPHLRLTASSPRALHLPLVSHSEAVAPDYATGGLGSVSGGGGQLYTSDGSSYVAPSLPFMPSPAAAGGVAAAPATTALLGNPAANEARLQKLSLHGLAVLTETRRPLLDSAER